MRIMVYYMSINKNTEPLIPKSCRMPVVLAEHIQAIADLERRQWSVQAIVFLEKGVRAYEEEMTDRYTALTDEQIKAVADMSEKIFEK